MIPPLPPGRVVPLPTGGSSFVRLAEGPPGAPVVLLLHGWTATADLNWFRCYEPLRRHFTVIALDHHGHGRGVRRRGRFRLEHCADDAAAVCAELGIDRVVAVGYSMGGPVAQLLWRRHPDLVDGLVLAATSRNFGRSFEQRAVFAGMLGLGQLAGFVPRPVRRGLVGRTLQGRFQGTPLGDWATSELRRHDPAIVLQAGYAIGRFSSHEWIHTVDVPTAVIVTAMDNVVPPRRQHRLAESIPGAREFVVAGDHGAVVMDAARFVPVLLEACRHAAAAPTRIS